MNALIEILSFVNLFLGGVMMMFSIFKTEFPKSERRLVFVFFLPIVVQSLLSIIYK